MDVRYDGLLYREQYLTKVLGQPRGTEAGPDYFIGPCAGSTPLHAPSPMQADLSGAQKGKAGLRLIVSLVGNGPK